MVPGAFQPEYRPGLSSGMTAWGAAGGLRSRFFSGLLTALAVHVFGRIGQHGMQHLPKFLQAVFKSKMPERQITRIAAHLPQLVRMVHSLSLIPL